MDAKQGNRTRAAAGEHGQAVRRLFYLPKRWQVNASLSLREPRQASYRLFCLTVDAEKWPSQSSSSTILLLARQAIAHCEFSAYVTPIRGFYYQYLATISVGLFPTFYNLTTEVHSRRLQVMRTRLSVHEILSATTRTLGNFVQLWQDGLSQSSSHANSPGI